MAVYSYWLLLIPPKDGKVCCCLKARHIGKVHSRSGEESGRRASLFMIILTTDHVTGTERSTAAAMLAGQEHLPRPGAEYELTVSGP